MEFDEYDTLLQTNIYVCERYVFEIYEILFSVIFVVMG